MKVVLIVLLILVLVCYLIGRIRIGGIVEYSEEGVLAKLRIGPFKWQLYPSKPKKKAASKQKKTKHKKEKGKEKKKKKTAPSTKPGKKKQKADQKAEETKEPSKRGGQLALLKELLPLGIQALGDFKRKLCIEELTLHYTISGRWDPAGAAVLYGRLCAGGGAVAALLENNFTIKKRHFSVWVDFTLEHALIYAKAALSFTLGQLICMGLYYGWKALCIFLKVKKEHQSKGHQSQEVKKNGKQASDQ